MLTYVFKPIGNISCDVELFKTAVVVLVNTFLYSKITEQLILADIKFGAPQLQIAN